MTRLIKWLFIGKWAMAASHHQIKNYRASIYNVFQAHIGLLPEIERDSPTEARAQSLNLMWVIALTSVELVLCLNMSQSS